MKNRVVKQWIAIITLSCVLTGYIAYDNLKTNSTGTIAYVNTPEEQQKLQEEYVQGALASVKSEIKDEVDDYIVQYVEQNDISNYFTEETINNITQSVTNTIISDDGDSSTKAEFEAMIADTIAQIDFTNYQSTSTASLTEDTKAYITNEVATAVQAQLTEANFSCTLSEEEKASVTSDLNTRVSSLESQIATILSSAETSTTTPDTTYTLSDEEMVRINDYVKNNLNISEEVAKYFTSTDTGTTVDTETLKTEIAANVTATLSDQINSIVKGADGYTPVKGVDYFTPDEINAMIDEIASQVQSGVDGTNGADGYTPVKGVDYFTTDEINAIIDQISATVQNGADGADGYTPVKGVDYFTDDEIASIVSTVQSRVVNGTDGVNGADGSDGLDAYEIAVEEGFSGTRAEWLNSLHGTDGANGYTPVKGTDYFTDEEINTLKTNILSAVSTSYDGIISDIETQINDIICNVLTETPSNSAKSFGL